MSIRPAKAVNNLDLSVPLLWIAMALDCGMERDNIVSYPQQKWWPGSRFRLEDVA
jgi:hypothetical protein